MGRSGPVAVAAALRGGEGQASEQRVWLSKIESQVEFKITGKWLVLIEKFDVQDML